MEPRLRASPQQFAVLVEFMERHGDLSRPQPSAQGRVRSDRMWLELTNILNSVGGGVQKTSDKWKKVWADWKTKTKRKYLGIRQHASGTGGGPSSRHSLTALEERVVAIIGVSAVVGQPGIEEQGFNRPSGSVQQEGSGHEFVIEVPSSQNTIIRESAVVGQPGIEEQGFNRPSGSVQQEGSGHEFVIEVPSSLNIAETPSTPPISTPPRGWPTQASTPAQPLPVPPSLPQPPSRPQPPSISQLPSEPQSPPPPRSRTPPARSQGRNRRQASVSPRSTATATSPRRSLLRARRNRGMTPFDRAASEFVAVEQRRLEHEEARDRRLHEREMERLRLEALRIEVSREHNQILQQLGLLGQRLLDFLTQRRPFTSSASTDILPDTE